MALMCKGCDWIFSKDWRTYCTFQLLGAPALSQCGYISQLGRCGFRRVSARPHTCYYKRSTHAPRGIQTPAPVPDFECRGDSIVQSRATSAWVCSSTVQKMCTFAQ